MDDTTYASPFSWRYGRAELRELFSERERRRLWRAVWVALARSQSRSGLVSAAELADITWKAAIEAAGARVRFFGNLRALTAYLLFPSWESLLKTLAFQVAPPLPS